LDGSVLASDTVLRVTKNQSEVFVKEKVMNAKFISLPSGMSLLYSDEENLKVTSDFVNINTVVSNFASQNFNIGKTSDIPTIFYDSYDGNLSKGYCALYLDGDWVENIVVTDEIKEDYVISALTGYYEDGVIYSAYNYNKITYILPLFLSCRTSPLAFTRRRADSQTILHEFYRLGSRFNRFGN